MPYELYTLRQQIVTAPDPIADRALSFYRRLVSDSVPIKSAAIITSFKFFRQWLYFSPLSASSQQEESC